LRRARAMRAFAFVSHNEVTLKLIELGTYRERRFGAPNRKNEI